MFLNIKSIVFTENHQKKFRFGPFRVKCGSFRFNPIHSDSFRFIPIQNHKKKCCKLSFLLVTIKAVFSLVND